MEIKTTFGKLPVGKYFNLKPNERYGWNAWVRCFDIGGTNARRNNDFRNFSDSTTVYIDVNPRSKEAKRYKQ
jgi:hypothetical protein